MNAKDDFDALLDPYHDALGEIIRGEDPKKFKALYAHSDDVTLGNPFGPVARGWEKVSETLERAATNYREGEIIGFENLAKCVTPELAYIVEVERYRAKVGGATELTPVSLRVTSIFRPEDGAWRVVHRHADPITGPRPAESVIEE
jgi:ketosteroid isomerase-like protein